MSTTSAQCMELLKTNNCFKKVKNPSHLLMDGTYGGIVSILPELEDTFLTMYATDVFLNNASLYFSEQKTQIFPMHFDIDEITLTSQQRLCVVRVIQQIVAVFYPKTNPLPQMLICDTSAADLKEPKLKKDFTCLHLFLPHIRVNLEKAGFIANACISKLTLLVPQYKWDKIIDLQLYTVNGLRLIGSRKMTACHVCHSQKKKRFSCSTCLGHKIDKGRPYDLVSILDSDGNYNEDLFQKIFSNHIKKVKSCSVRCIQNEEETPDFLKYDGCPSLDFSIRKDILELQSTFLDKTKTSDSVLDSDTFEKYLEISSQIAKRTKKSIDSDKKEFDVEIEKNTLAFQVAREEIQNYSKKYITSQLETLKTNHYRSIYFAKICGDGMHCCGNVPPNINNGEHHGSSVFFQIDRSGISQKCFSRKPGARLNNETCQQFKGEVKKLSNKAALILFPALANYNKGLNPIQQLWRSKRSLMTFIENGGTYPKIKKAHKKKAQTFF